MIHKLMIKWYVEIWDGVGRAKITSVGEHSVTNCEDEKGASKSGFYLPTHETENLFWCKLFK